LTGLERLVCALCNALPLSNKYYMGQDKEGESALGEGKEVKEIQETV